MEPHSIYVLIFFIVCLFLYYKTLERFTSIDFDAKLTDAEKTAKIKQLQDALYECKIQNANIKTDVIKQIQLRAQVDSPTRIYQNPRNEIYSQYSQVGYIYNEYTRYPLYGRHKYPGRSDKWLYYIVDEGRARIKIPVKRNNDEELSNGDSINVLGAVYSVEIYDYDTLEYNPNIL